MSGRLALEGDASCFPLFPGKQFFPHCETV